MITVGIDKLEYIYDVRSLVVNLLETKILINSKIVDTQKETHLILTDMKNYFFTILIKELEYFRVKYHYLLLDIYRKYNLDALVSKDSYIYIKIQKGMSRLMQAVILIYEHLKCCLLLYGYEPTCSTIE